MPSAAARRHPEPRRFTPSRILVAFPERPQFHHICPIGHPTTPAMSTSPTAIRVQERAAPDARPLPHAPHHPARNIRSCRELRVVLIATAVHGHAEEPCAAY